MQLKTVKRLVIAVQAIVLLSASVQSQTQRYTPSPVKGYSDSMSYIFLQDAVPHWLPDLFELDANEVLSRVSVSVGTTTPLSRHRLQYLDGIVNSTNKSRIEVIWDVKSKITYITENDLYSLGQKCRMLREDFFTSVNIPGYIRTYKAISATDGKKIVIETDGSVNTIETDLDLYGETDLLLNYFSSDWTKVLQEGTYTQLDGGKQKVVAKIKDVKYTLLLNSDGTFSGITYQGRMPGGWTMKTVCHFDEWTTGSTILLPGKMDWSTSLVDNGVEVTLVDSHIRLLNLGDKDFMSQALSRKNPQ